MSANDTAGPEPPVAADAGGSGSSHSTSEEPTTRPVSGEAAAGDNDGAPPVVGGAHASSSPRLRRTGGILLALTGATNLLLGLGLFVYAFLGGFAGVPPLTVAAFAAPIAAGGLAGLAGGAAGYAGRYWYVAVAAGVLGLVFAPLPVFIPVELFALVLFALTEDQFR